MFASDPRPTISPEAWTARASSLFQPGRNCTAVVEARRAALLIDAESYFRALRDACLRAQRSILMLGWDFNSRTCLDFEACEGAEPSVPPMLGDFLNFVAKRRRGVHIYVLNWDYPMVFSANRELRPIYGLGWKPHRRVRVRYDNTHPTGGSQHQKIVVIDDAVAFCGGIDLTARRWDSCDHRADDARRTWEGAPYPPFHDVMALVDGEAAAALGEVARARWLNATGRRVAQPGAAGDPWPPGVTPQMTDVITAVARTMPATQPTGEVREVEALYLDMIAAAEDLIFLENQYFTSDRLGEALARRLAEDDPPEIVVITRLLSHGWLEEQTMEALRTRLVKRLREADSKGRFEIYYPHVSGLKEGTCVDVHSKVTVIDDQWLRVGSANFSNRSMGLDSECDVAFEAGADRARRAAVEDFRDGLISEHLGVRVAQWRAALKEQRSCHAAIRALHSEARTLKPLERLPEASDAAMALISVADPERPVSIDLLVEQFSSDETASTRRRGPAWGTIASFALAVLALTLAWRYTPLAEYVTAERVREWAGAARGTWWAPLAVVLAYLPTAFVMLPRPLVTVFGVVALGPLAGFATAMAGVALSGACCYYIGRAVRRDTVRRIAGRSLNRMTKLLRQRGLAASFACSIAPVAPFIAVAMVAGAMRVRLWHYLAGMLAGMLPGALATTLFADQLAAALEDPARINWWMVAAVAVVFVALLAGARRWMKTLEAPAAPAAAAA
jgi:phosphatidylserine/phosphatidylglycerophosphate/cardiolipin synthase-like enzyme/uncharacterized membrane protein YdjX (TVP38/TMEM64 family)